MFGFGGWSYTIALTRDAVEQAETKSGPQWQAAYTCVCTLTVQTETGMVVRQAVGFGSGFAKQIGDAIEGATKEAETDALKRAARTFGNIFGLALYDKSRANVQAPPPATITEAQRDEMMLLLDGLKFPVAELLRVSKITDLSQLRADKFDGAKGWVHEQAKKEAA